MSGKFAVLGPTRVQAPKTSGARLRFTAALAVTLAQAVFALFVNANGI
jgi:hypothetical protein